MSNTTPSPPDTETPVVELTGTLVPTVATEMRRRRELLGWSQAEAARRSGVSRTVINEIEHGRRVPQTRTYERLRAALGLEIGAAPALLRRHAPQEWTERQLATLAACVLSGHGGSLAALADAVGVSIPAVREQLSMLGERLAAVGLCAVEDGDVVRVMPLPWAADAVAEVATLELERVLSDEAVEVLVIGGEDCEGLLARLCRRGLLLITRDDSLRGDPYLYRVTATALGVMGHGTLESFQAWCARHAADPNLGCPGDRESAS